MLIERTLKDRRAPIIGFLAARFDEAYQNTVWRGAVQEAERIGAAVVFFGGQRVGSPVGYEALDNIAFDLAKHSRMVGIIVMSNVIGTYLSNKEQLEFLDRFGRTQVVSIGVEFPGIPSVLVDAAGGMSSIAEHLLVVHERSRFLFLAGPKRHIESEARMAEFMRSVEADSLGAPSGPSERSVELIYGDFTEEDAHDKVTRFLDSGLAIDAIVAANDLMAVGAIRALAERGIEVPREVSVTGFDDTEDSRFSVPPLTTIRQPAIELGRLAVMHIAARLGVGPEPPAAQPTVSFVVRESCGCPYNPGTEDPVDADGHPYASWPPEPLAALSAEVNRDIREGRNPSRLRRLAFDPAIREAALLAIAEGECRFLASQRIAVERRVSVFGDIEASLVSSFTLEHILGQIARGSRELGITGCWLSLFESKGTSPEWSKLLLASDSKGTRILAPYGLRFRTAELVPGGLPRSSCAFVCEPLRFGDDRLGYLLCTADSTERRMYEALRDQVSSALKGAFLMAAERDRERSLERAVRARTLELSMANSRLVEEMAQRKGLERELLEISNRIVGKIGQDIHDNLCQDIAGLGIMAAVLEGSLRREGLSAEGDAAAALSLAAGETAARAKGIARGLYPAELEAKGIVRAVERLVQSARERNEATIKLEVTSGFAVRDSEKALHLYRIVQEALNNSIRHSAAKEIRVGLYMDRETVTAEISDDGIGMPLGDRDDGGMGLHILKYRASVIGGELRIRSKDDGTTVTCRVAK